MSFAKKDDLPTATGRTFLEATWHAYQRPDACRWQGSAGEVRHADWSPPTLAVREDRLLRHVDAWLTQSLPPIGSKRLRPEVVKADTPKQPRGLRHQARVSSSQWSKPRRPEAQRLPLRGIRRCEQGQGEAGRSDYDVIRPSGADLADSGGSKRQPRPGVVLVRGKFTFTSIASHL